ncbi:MAG: MarR family transcriptional regulator [Bacteroidia bacterium]|nr:MarR family transcriptional regulator [Bacteroidia bacterium]
MKQARSLTREVFHRHEIEVTTDQWVILKAIAEKEGSSQQEISELTFREPAAITRMLDHLIKQGFVSKQIDDADRRKQLLFLTETGSQLYQRAMPIVKSIREHALTDLTEAERDTFRNILKRVYGAIQEDF